MGGCAFFSLAQFHVFMCVFVCELPVSSVAYVPGCVCVGWQYAKAGVRAASWETLDLIGNRAQGSSTNLCVCVCVCVYAHALTPVCAGVHV